MTSYLYIYFIFEKFTLIFDIIKHEISFFLIAHLMTDYIIIETQMLSSRKQRKFHNLFVYLFTRIDNFSTITILSLKMSKQYFVITKTFESFIIKCLSFETSINPFKPNFVFKQFSRASARMIITITLYICIIYKFLLV